MKAVQFNFTIPRYVVGLALGRWFPSVLWSGLSCTVMREVPEPSLLSPDWVKVKTRLGGICGTDLGNIHQKTSPYYTPFGSYPFTFGHENVGTLAELGRDVKGWELGQRVVVEPTLWCEPRGFAKEDWCEFCKRGEINLCQRYTQGKLSPGILIGTNRDTGGSWSTYFLAHKSQLYAVPESVSNENALMAEPFSCGLHAALFDFPHDEEKILILGAGTIGLITLAALRSLGCKAQIWVSARYDFQVDAARRLGASEVLRGGDIYEQTAKAMNAQLLKPAVGKRVVIGGFDRVYECVGSDRTLDDANRLARTHGKVIVVGVPGIAKGLDWAAIYSQELQVQAVDRGGHAENFRGKKWDAFNLALDLMKDGKVNLGWMVSRKYELTDYKKALGELTQKDSHSLIKAAFEFAR